MLEQNFCWNSLNYRQIEDVVLFNVDFIQMRSSGSCSFNANLHGLLGIMRVVKRQNRQNVDMTESESITSATPPPSNNYIWLMNTPIVVFNRFAAATAAAVDTVSITNATAVRSVGPSSVHYPTLRILSIRTGFWVVRTHHKASCTRSTPPPPGRFLFVLNTSWLHSLK